MKELVFLLEEASAKALLETLLPRLLSNQIHFRLISGLAKKQSSRKFRTPDALSNPSHELKQLTQQVYEKVSGSRAIGQYIDLDNTRSLSFRKLIEGIRRLENELLLLG